ncbi:protein croquemort-like [Penaeus japonicus]|uniref:protein croquemort-like n=1 Tax=Penaeus japonicus TaxID=27405 RepID=UPI001C714601|nr:protein croquemort-like [Penaeus japonicus]
MGVLGVIARVWAMLCHWKPNGDQQLHADQKQEEALLLPDYPGGSRFSLCHRGYRYGVWGVPGDVRFHHEVGSRTGINSSTPIRSKKKLSCCQITLVVLGSLSAIGGIVMVSGGYQAMFDSIMKSQMAITEGSASYDMWRVPPMPLYLQVYFFNITNPDEFVRGAKPILQEVGPYCYREYHEKKELVFHPNNTVTFFQQRWWIWDQEKSGNHSTDDLIVGLNTIPVSAAWSVRKSNLALNNLNKMINDLGEELIVAVPAGELLFDGYADPILDWVQDNVMAENGTYHPILPILPIPPGIKDYDRFGWFYGRNLSLSYDGEFNMKTGHDTLANIGVIDWWNKTRETEFFDYPCNRVEGSAGEMWPPNLQKDFVQFYSSDLCMTMKLFYKGEIEDSHGISGFRYWGSDRTFANGSVVPGNECYCVKGTCAPTGLLSGESCRMGSPSYISFPHFLNADPYLLDTVEGLHPDEERHAFVMDMIPELGTPMWVAARMQINMLVMPYPGKQNGRGRIDLLSDVPEVYMPLMWFEVAAGVPEEMVGQLQTLLFMMRTPTMTIIFSVMIGLGLLTVALVLGLHWRKNRKTIV